MSPSPSVASATLRSFLTQLGDDAHGEQVREWLHKAGVRVTSSATTKTATATAHLDESGSARYEFDISWSLAAAAPARSDDVGIVHTGSIAALMAPGAAAVSTLLTAMRETSLITYDPNVRPALLPDHRRAVADVESFVGPRRPRESQRRRSGVAVSRHRPPSTSPGRGCSRGRR